MVKRHYKIVQVISNSPNAKPIPTANQGGTEKIVYELTESLVKRGHDVYVFAAKGSRTSAKLITYPKKLKKGAIKKFVLRRIPSKIDIIHDHTFNSALGKARLRIPTVCTIHMPSKNRVKYPVYVSRRARKVMGNNRGFCVYNGINPSEYQFSSKKNDYLLFLGRIIKEKGVLHAITIAEKTHKRLIIAGPIKDKHLFQKYIAPRIRSNPRIHYVGPVGGKRKQELLKHAKCVLFPSIWEEPFGLVMIEALACGTPVIALKRGSVPEVLAGFPQLICNSIPEMIKKVNIGIYPAPDKLRKYVISRFTTARMTTKYLQIYKSLLKKKRV
ncbi:glycosyltransferase family 4 protein [Paenibacillus aestuarii]|uniref:Glycosyltransferase family 4 protein n=1 Tax=Paenibacillus aestuarii TaxID=516965 RepID=A0ABW0KI94_9BACL|nr:glycosyltransferase family 4 protein [Paenibacillus aestuarii]